MSLRIAQRSPLAQTSRQTCCGARVERALPASNGRARRRHGARAGRRVAALAATLGGRLGEAGEPHSPGWPAASPSYMRVCRPCSLSRLLRLPRFPPCSLTTYGWIRHLSRLLFPPPTRSAPIIPPRLVIPPLHFQTAGYAAPLSRSRTCAGWSARTCTPRLPLVSKFSECSSLYGAGTSSKLLRGTKMEVQVNEINGRHLTSPLVRW